MRASIFPVARQRLTRFIAVHGATINCLAAACAECPACTNSIIRCRKSLISVVPSCQASFRPTLINHIFATLRILFRLKCSRRIAQQGFKMPQLKKRFFMGPPQLAQEQTSPHGWSAIQAKRYRRARLDRKQCQKEYHNAHSASKNH